MWFSSLVFAIVHKETYPLFSSQRCVPRNRFFFAGVALHPSRPTGTTLTLPSAFVLVQQSIVEFLTNPQHPQDPLHRRLVNPLASEFGVYRRKDLDYMTKTGFPNQKLVSFARGTHFMGRSCRQERGLGRHLGCHGQLWWLAGRLTGVTTFEHALFVFCHASLL